MNDINLPTGSAHEALVPLSVMAAELGVSVADLRREALAGRVPCVRVGERSLLFDRERVRQLLLGRATEGVSP